MIGESNEEEPYQLNRIKSCFKNLKSFNHVYRIIFEKRYKASQ